MNQHINSLLFVSLVFVLASCTATPSAHAKTDKAHETVVKNVSYSDVISQPYDKPFLTMSYGSDPQQYGQLWLPKSGEHENTPPLIIFIHGGCWLNAYDIKHSYPFTSALAQQGFLVWSLEYRRTGDEGGGWPGSYQDILVGIEFIKKQSTFKINSDQIVLTGHSAGGHLALLAGSHFSSKELVGIIGLAPIVDIESYSDGDNSCQQAGEQFMGGTADELPDQYKRANPVFQTLHPISILLQGSADTIVPVTQTTNTSISQVVLTGVGHFDWIHPHTDAFELLVGKIEEITNQ